MFTLVVVDSNFSKNLILTDQNKKERQFLIYEQKCERKKISQKIQNKNLNKMKDKQFRVQIIHENLKIALF